MPWTRLTRMVGLCLAMLLVVTMLAACGGDDDDDDATATTSTNAGGNTGTVAAGSGTDATATTADEAAESTATVATSAEATATSGTSGGDVDPTATSGTGMATAEATEAAPVAPTSTGTGTGTDSTPTTSASIPEECETAAEDIESLDPDLIPNFSVRFEVAYTGDADEGTELGTITMSLEQSEPGTYHSSVESDDFVLESWVIGDKAWSDFGMGVTESEPGADLFPPDVLLSQMNEGLRDFYDASESGSEEVNGRDTTLYVIDGEDYADGYNRCAGDSEKIDEASGELRYWIDEEWGVMIKGEGNMEWTYSDGTSTTFEFNQDMFDIGDTAAIEPPV